MTDHTPTETSSFDYFEELPADKERVWSLLQSYSHIPANEVESHLRDICEKGWKVFPYGCISHWIFLDCVITSSPEYSNILECLKSGGVLLDAGCAFGYILRQLAIDGAPAANLIGVDLQQGFLDLGYDLFKDRATFEGRYLAGDLLDPDDHSLNDINGKVDIIHAGALLHLFDWEDQVVLGTKLVKFYKTG